MEASQTLDYCVAKDATQRAARPDPSPRKERLLGMTPDNNAGLNPDAIYFVASGAVNTSFSSVAVVAASRLSLTKTVSPCSSITTGPSSVVQEWRPFSSSSLE